MVGGDILVATRPVSPWDCDELIAWYDFREMDFCFVYSLEGFWSLIGRPRY